MNLKNKLKNYKIWIAMISAALMLIQAFGLKVDIPVLREALIGVCGVFVMLGILSNPDKKKTDK